MFSALVEPACQGLIALYRQEEEEQRDLVDTGDLSMWENGGDASLAVGYIYDHLEAFQLIICKSQGTKYESFLHDLAVIEEETTLSFMKQLKKQGMKIRDFRKEELHLLVTVNVSAVFQTVEHGFTREEAMHYAQTLDCFFSKGWKEFFGY